MKKSYIVGVVLVVLFAVIAFFSLKGSMAPYVKFQEARDGGEVVQIAGKVVPDSQKYGEDGTFRFLLESPEKDRMEVDFSGTKPGNFDQAANVVALGAFREGLFRAERLLVKCPSKYEERLTEAGQASEE